MFGQKCLISEGYCEIGNNVIVWNANEVWHVCPFAKITDTFVVELNITKINRYYWTSNNKWLFSVNTDKFETCECDGTQKKFYKTTEGAYIYLKNSASDTLSCAYTSKDINSMMELMLAEGDFERLKNFNEKQDLNINNCENLKAQINIYKYFNNQLFLLNNLENNLVIYVKNNVVYTPKCTIVNEIELINESEFCFKDIPIKFKKNNKTLMGFLT